MRVAVLGWWGYTNAGDDLLLQVATRMLEPHQVHPISIPLKATADLVRRLNHFDLVILGPGGLIQGGPPAPFDSYGEWGAQLQVPVLGLGLGVSTLNDRHRVHMDALIDSALGFHVRDRQSQTILGHPKVSVWPDLVFAKNELGGPSPAPNWRHPPVCAVNLRSVSWAVEPWEQALRSLPVRLQALPLCFHPRYGDTAAIRRLGLTPPKELALGTLHEADFLIGMRYHAIVLAMVWGRPPIAVCYAPKVRRVMEAAGLGEYALEPGEAHLLDETVGRLLAHYEEAQAKAEAFARASRAELSKLREALAGNVRRLGVPRPPVAAGLVSVALPESLPGTHLVRLLESLRAQTYAELEIVAAPRAAALCTRDGIASRPVRWEGSASAAERLNACLEACSGRYLTWLPPSAWLAPDAIETMVEAMLDDPGRPGVYGGYYITGPRGEIEYAMQPYPPDLVHLALHPAPLVMVRRSAWERLRPFRPAGEYEYGFWYQAARIGGVKPVEVLLGHREGDDASSVAAAHRERAAARLEYRRHWSRRQRWACLARETRLVRGMRRIRGRAAGRLVKSDRER